MLQLKILQQNAMARLDIQDPFLKMRITDVQVRISSEPVKLDISQPPGELSIDQYPSNYSRGDRNFMDFDRENAQKGMRALQDFIGKIAREGIMLNKIEHKGKPLVQLAKEAIKTPISNLGLAPVASPDIRYTPREAKIKVEPGQLSIRFVDGTFDSELERGSVNLTMLQYPQVHVQVSDSSVDMEV
ncbi:DUF6470 family protein [Propionispora vibrioides]|uniref:Uncharacterized protein n=1 Tax=Propionispora vibrioides TaxID=112903 RepID=A0A1H8RZ20_9FIRM|nr:DUF6470 family protein [Propionispora vibrioides]SEO71193.1 hypothetical protein SAMN04490178_104120 [Propionispora vibrioides]